MKHNLVIWDSRIDNKTTYNVYVFGVSLYADSIETLKGKVLTKYPGHVFDFALSSQLQQQKLPLGEDVG